MYMLLTYPIPFLTLLYLLSEATSLNVVSVFPADKSTHLCLDPQFTIGTSLAKLFIKLILEFSAIPTLGTFGYAKLT